MLTFNSPSRPDRARFCSTGHFTVSSRACRCGSPHLATGGSMHLAEFMKHPRLTNAGVYFRIALQHGGLWFAAFYFLSGLSHSVAGRATCVIFFASHPLFYGYAHCVGSESLSMIQILLLAGVGLRMVDAYPSVRMEHWLLAGCYCLFILTRHINLVLVGLVPLCFLLFGLASRFSRGQLKSKVFVPSYPLKRYLWTLGEAVTLGLIVMEIGKADILTSFAARSASKCAPGPVTHFCGDSIFSVQCQRRRGGIFLNESPSGPLCRKARGFSLCCKTGSTTWRRGSPCNSSRSRTPP